MRIEPDVSGVQIVLLGRFNPSIFTPWWLAKYDLATDEEAAAAEISVIHAEIAVLRIGKKSLQIELDKFNLDITEGPWISASDFVVRLFGELLAHTPITKLGINRFIHFSVGSEEVRNAIGRKLAPLEPWGAWGRQIDESPADRRGGAIKLVMQEAWKADEFRGHIQADVEPSRRIAGNAGIFVAINNHVELVDSQDRSATEKIVRYLQENFDEAIAKSEAIVDNVMSLKEAVA